MTQISVRQAMLPEAGSETVSWNSTEQVALPSPLADECSGRFGRESRDTAEEE